MKLTTKKLHKLIQEQLLLENQVAHGLMSDNPKLVMKYLPLLDKQGRATYRIEKGMEKKLLRDSFQDFLPTEVLYRTKEAFSDGVSGIERSWFEIIADKLKSIDIPILDFNNEYLTPRTKEQMYYRYIFEKNYHNRENVIPYFWMPKWSNTTDPSARTL